MAGSNDGGDYGAIVGTMTLAAHRQDLAALRAVATECLCCPLAPGREKVVFGDGDPEADLMIIGEAPGSEEDKQGLPFRGAAGDTLDELLHGIGLQRTDIYIANVVMCRPPDNRRPRVLEARTCAPYLAEQIRLVEPRVILTLGAAATRRMLGPSATIAGTRDRDHIVGGRTIVPTYHPSPLSLNRVQARRAMVEADFRRAKSLLVGRRPTG